MNLLTNTTIFKKTGLLLLVILFFLGCKKEKSKVGIDDPGRLPSGTYFTDTITIKSQVVLINDSINTTNVSTNDANNHTSSLMLAGAYSDPLMGKIAAEAYSRLSLSQEYRELPAATADSAFLYLSYSYYYGNILQAQTLNVYALTGDISSTTTYLSTSPAISYDPTPIGTATFNASSDTGSVLKISISSAYAQTILNASKNNTAFPQQIKGLAIVPASNNAGAIIRIDGNHNNTSLQIHYTQYGSPGIYYLNMNYYTPKFFRVTADRTGTDLASLVNNYDSISTDALPTNSQRCYLQACTGIRTRLTFPHLLKLREAFPNIAVMRAELLIRPSTASNIEAFPMSEALVLHRTENGLIKKSAAGTMYYVQPDDYTQTGTSSINLVTPTDNQYSFPIRSYIQALLLEKLPNHPVILSPVMYYVNYSGTVVYNRLGVQNANRVVFDDNANSQQPLKLNLYFTTTK